MKNLLDNHLDIALDAGKEVEKVEGYSWEAWNRTYACLRNVWWSWSSNKRGDPQVSIRDGILFLLDLLLLISPNFTLSSHRFTLDSQLESITPSRTMMDERVFKKNAMICPWKSYCHPWHDLVSRITLRLGTRGVPASGARGYRYLRERDNGSCSSHRYSSSHRYRISRLPQWGNRIWDGTTRRGKPERCAHSRLDQ